jgi:cell shape-determining protein MreD
MSRVVSLTRIAAPLRWRPAPGRGLRYVALLIVVGAFVQSVLPRVDIGSLEGIPNLLVAVVVAVAALRGVMVGACAGFAGGLLLELITPSATLGLFALAYVVIGAWCGRFAESGESIGRWRHLALSTAAAALVPVWLAVVEILRGAGPPVNFVLNDLVLPQLAFAPFVALPAWWATRRLLGEPRVLEPWLVNA